MTKNRESKISQLYQSLLTLKTEQEVKAYCTDLMTPQEIESFADRLEVALELAAGKPQRKVAEETGVSIATVTRVNKALTRGEQGYKLVIGRNHSHSVRQRLASTS
jgi:TrpR-related protein YerC/YecD